MLTVIKNELESLLQKSAKIIYIYFIKKVVDYEVVWGLHNDGWATAEDGDGNILIPFYPKREFAEHFAKNEWKDCKATAIDLYDFMDSWLIGMKKDGVKPSIFPIDEDTILTEIDILLKDLNTELENY